MLNGCSEKHYGKKRQCTILKFQNFLNSRYGKCTMVFDRYLPSPSIKDYEHMRRLAGGGSTTALNMSVKLENIFNEVSQKSFWAALTTNKNSMTYFLSKYKRLCHPTVVRCTSDADTMNVFIVLDHSCTGGNVELIAADTYLLIMLVHFWNSLIRRDNYEAWGYKKA